MIEKFQKHIYQWNLFGLNCYNLPHFHDELMLKCLVCNSHSEKACKPILRLKDEIESLYPFFWQGTDIRVFKLEVKE